MTAIGSGTAWYKDKIECRAFRNFRRHNLNLKLELRSTHQSTLKVHRSWMMVIEPSRKDKNLIVTWSWKEIKQQRKWEQILRRGRRWQVDHPLKAEPEMAKISDMKWKLLVDCKWSQKITNKLGRKIRKCKAIIKSQEIARKELRWALSYLHRNLRLNAKRMQPQSKNVLNIKFQSEWRPKCIFKASWFNISRIRPHSHQTWRSLEKLPWPHNV